MSNSTASVSINSTRKEASTSALASSTGGAAAALALESKLHTVAASFRQSRDEAHRAQQLATERLRLAVEECNAVAATVSAATQHLQHSKRSWC
jgi:hypothetical protein